MELTLSDKYNTRIDHYLFLIQIVRMKKRMILIYG